MTVPTDISLRDYFAGQALIGLLARPPMPAGEAAWLAYGQADRMLARREKDGERRDHEIEALTRRAETAERSLEIFRAADDYTSRVALAQLWELLDADNQTQAVAAISVLKEHSHD